MVTGRSRLAGLLCCLAITIWCPNTVAEDDQVRFRLGGLLFGDLYHVASHHTVAGDGSGGAVLRRGYLTATFDLGEHWRGRARIEVNQDGQFESYSFDTRLKDLYLARTIGRQELVFGPSPTLTYDLIESTWGARYLMRTPLDLQGVPSRDTGVTLKGPLGRGGRVGYRAMYGSGLEYADQGGGGDKLMGALNWSLSSGVQIDLYADYEKRAGNTDRNTWQLFAKRHLDHLRPQHGRRAAG
jgi:hypothetical protein